ncbi:MAG: hypothetical protein IKH46_13280 [Lachnospiraceae bacterium]|nr:hypothetical protein [Lachnospiraceae bacterium]
MIQNRIENVYNLFLAEGEKNARYRWGYSIITAAVIVLAEFLYFRAALADGRCFGVSEDGLLINMILEHWNNVFQNGQPVDTLEAFYPQTGTLGYSDILLGPGIIYTLFRYIGADVFGAYNSTVITLHMIGVVFMYLALREVGCSRIGGVLGLFLSFWSCSFSQLTWHVQFFALTYIAMAVWGIIGMLKRKGGSAASRLPFLVWTTISIGEAFLSSFYTAYLTTVFCIVTVLVHTVVTIIRRDDEKKDLGKKVIKYWKEFVVGGVLQLPWLVILFVIYMPVYKELGSYDTGFTLALSPVPVDFFRTLSYAPLETAVRTVLPFQIDPGYEMWVENILMERSYGWPLTATVFLIVLFVYTIRKRGKDEGDRIFLSVVFSMLILFLVSCRYGDFSPWIHFVAKFLPGAGAIRATGRCLGVLVIPMTICICSRVRVIEKDGENESGIKKRMGILGVEIILIFLLLFSSLCKRYALEDKDYFRQILSGCERPPEDCEIMLMVFADPAVIYSPELQMVAWMIADECNIQTINGYTGNYPRGWNLANNTSEEYLFNVQQWLMTKGITDHSHIYAYIPEENHWIKYEEIAQVGAH